nr:Chain B, SF3b1 U2AF ligand motif [Homo sapiens]
NRWDETP